MKKITSFIFLSLILLIANCTLLIDNCRSQWVQQSVPVTSGSFNDMKFVNANTGFIAHYSYPVGTFLKTTNAGYNWTVNLNAQIQNISVVDSLNIYCTVNRGLYDKLFKTTNCGISWDSSLTTPLYLGYLYFFNKDTGMISIGDGSNNYIARITDGGQSYQIIATYGGASAGKFFFLKEKINGEYYGWMYYPGSFKLRYTTNSGLVWLTHPDFSYNFNSLYFVNKDTGWATTTSYTNYIYMTTNGGVNWVGKYNGLNEVYYDIYFANSQKGWVSGLINKVCITTNGGNNWGTQNLISFYTSKMFFLDSLNGWIETTSSTISHTTNGGGPITRIANNTNYIASDYKLYQNYPNPFNPSTTIKYFLIFNSYVELKIFDISGKEIINVVSKEQNKGTYEKLIDFTNITSGIYFYRLSIKDNNRLNTVFSETKRMVFLK